MEARDKQGKAIMGHAVIADGRKVVATAGTAEALSATSQMADHLVIVAETDNTGVIAVGDSTVVATVLTRRGVPLMAGEALVLDGVDISKVYLDTTVNGDGVTYLAVY